MILVTGATGFVGSHLVCQSLAKGKVVRALKRSSSAMKEFNFVFAHYFSEPAERNQMQQRLDWAEGDVTDVVSLEAAMQGCTQVYHCAAVVSFDAANRNLLFHVNVEGTANVVNLCLITGIKELAYVSSVAALGRAKSGDWHDENTHWVNSKLNTTYAISKYRAELEVWRGAEEGLSVTMVNPGIIIGAGHFNKGSNTLVGAVYKGIPGYAPGVNGYVDVKDVARSLILLMDQKCFGNRYVMVGANLSLKDLFFMLADGFGKKRPSIEVKPWMMAVAWRLIWVVRLFTTKGLPITRETARAALNKSYYRSERIVKELNFAFTPMEKTIAECCSTYLNYISKI